MWPRVTPLTILGLAGAVVWLQQVTFHTAAGEGAICVGAELAAGAVHRALVEVCQAQSKGRVVCRAMRAGKCVPSDATTVHPYSYVRWRTINVQTQPASAGLEKGTYVHTIHSLRKYFLSACSVPELS